MAEELRQDVLDAVEEPAGVQALVLDYPAELLVGDPGEVLGPGAVDGLQQVGRLRQGEILGGERALRPGKDAQPDEPEPARRRDVGQDGD